MGRRKARGAGSGTVPDRVSPEILTRARGEWMHWVVVVDARPGLLRHRDRRDGGVPVERGSVPARHSEE